MPATLALYLFASMYDRRVAMRVLLAASIVFYAYWDINYSFLLLGSISVNYQVSRAILRNSDRRRLWLAIGIAANLVVIGWFKYSFFLHTNLFWYIGDSDFFANMILPLGISFFTFQQIAFLVDVSQGKARPPDIGTYALFVSFFPQLIAGPIVLYRNVASQLLSRRKMGICDAIKIRSGLTLFAVGLFKKVVIADSLSPFSRAAFGVAASSGASIGFADAWLGALAYSLQLYFDFSGYSDMAVGLARIFGIRIPQNFNSPYKATSIVDFWRRWHMTLTNFFRCYVYIPLGGNKLGLRRQMINIGIVFLLTGFWHGAGWTFIVWGMLHGFLVMANHAWTTLLRPILHLRVRVAVPERVFSLLGWGPTMLCVILLWVVFRSPDLATAGRMLSAMAGGSALFQSYAFVTLGFVTVSDYATLIATISSLFFVAATFPNSMAIACHLWRMRVRHLTSFCGRWGAFPAAAFIGAALYMALASLGEVQSEFLYFQF